VTHNKFSNIVNKIGYNNPCNSEIKAKDRLYCLGVYNYAARSCIIIDIDIDIDIAIAHAVAWEAFRL
jgi:hypothetical protein